MWWICFMGPAYQKTGLLFFYRFSDQSVYYRYFAPIKAMPHSKMQKYVNVDFSQVLSIVGLVGESGQGHVIAEARFFKDRHRPWADVAFVVDEKFQGLGIASYLYKMLIRCARDRGIQSVRGRNVKWFQIKN